MSQQQKVPDIVQSYRPAKTLSSGASKAEPIITSLDFDDNGEHLVAASTDDNMTIYDVKNATKTKNIPSKKYGVHLARFTHHGRQIIFASTKQDDSLRLLELHNESFVRYFTSHTSQVTCVALSPSSDNFLSCGSDDTVCLWDVNSRTPAGKLKLTTPYLAAYDPSATVMAIASQSTQSILLYDVRNFDKAPFAVFDLQDPERRYCPSTQGRAWTKLEFSNDGKWLLLGTDYHGHFLLDSFDGDVKAFLVGKIDGSGRAAPVSTSGKAPGQGDVAFTQDGRYVIGGTGANDLLVWDTNLASGNTLEAMCKLSSKGIRSPIVAVNPRYNQIATADQKLTMWLPGQHNGAD